MKPSIQIIKLQMDYFLILSTWDVILRPVALTDLDYKRPLIYSKQKFFTDTFKVNIFTLKSFHAAKKDYKKLFT